MIILVEFSFVQGYWIFQLYFIVNDITSMEISGKFLSCFVLSISFFFMLLLETVRTGLSLMISFQEYLQNLNKKSKIMPLFIQHDVLLCSEIPGYCPLILSFASMINILLDLTEK